MQRESDRFKVTFTIYPDSPFTGVDAFSLLYQYLPFLDDFFLHIHLLCMMGRFYFQTIIQFSVITGCEVRK